MAGGRLREKRMLDMHHKEHNRKEQEPGLHKTQHCLWNMVPKLWRKEQKRNRRIRTRRKQREITLHIYIGETSRSGYERGLEHTRDLQELKPDSHMLKHYLEHHKNENMEKMKFGKENSEGVQNSFWQTNPRIRGNTEQYWTWTT